MSKLFDIKHQLLQYATHHNHPVNVAIHLTCIPLILWSALVFAATSGPLLPSPSPAAVASGATFPVLVDKVFQFATPNLAWAVMVGYVGYYFALDKETAFISAPLFLGAAKFATDFYLTNPSAIRIASYIHITAWIAQFIGHGVFEKRAPKLIENLIQALVLAPYFVVWEFLFMIGYRPQLKRELDVLVDANIKAFRARKTAAAGGKAGNQSAGATVAALVDEKKEQ
ncbi:hypothetical protein EC957_005860 [Mortierella hygrophila]|uniref:DUF962-domain-containing protein n=1 Tax=Mortierella hygrophila TaxID=979708 RepID=A0A9P6EZS2_9FUNG|nr:hypothetical protein EC957_005860 [Mortierella hygrophila]